VYFDDVGWLDAAIFTIEHVAPGDILAGPAILEDPRSTTVVLPGQVGHVDEFGHLHIAAAQG
jgi:N-methylhydantoinase A/oxoprolinase/acetone carboxylase beta subunit